MGYVYVLRGQAVVIDTTPKASFDSHSMVVHVSLLVGIIEGRARALNNFLHRHVASIWIGVLL